MLRVPSAKVYWLLDTGGIRGRSGGADGTRSVPATFQHTPESAGQSPRVLGEAIERLVENAEHRAAEHTGQRHLVARIGHGAEQIDDVEDFLLGVEGVPADKVVVDAVLPQGLFIILDICKRPEQERDIARPAGAENRLACDILVPYQLFAVIEHGAQSRRAIHRASRRRLRLAGLPSGSNSPASFGVARP